MNINVSKSIFNSVYLPLLESEKRYLVLYGGAGSGKSYFAAQRYILKLLEPSKSNLLVIRQVQNTHRNSTYALLKQVISQWKLDHLFKSTVGTMQIECLKTKNSIIFRGLDNSEKIKSITFPHGELTDIWIEEASEITESDFNQLDIRLRGNNISGQITLTFNPVSMLHWLKKRFFDCDSDNTLVLKTTYLDNKFLSSDYGRLLKSFQKSDPYYYQVYCLGEWGIYGKTVFNSEGLTERLQNLPEPVAFGSFLYQTYYDTRFKTTLIRDDKITFSDSANGAIRIYKQPNPRSSYAIGCDTAGEGSDWFCAQVIDCLSGEQVCVFRQKMDEDLFAKQVYCLGIYYSTALISIEANFSSYPIKELEKLQYPKQYVRVSEDNFTHRTKESFGFRTTAITRPVIISMLIEISRDKPYLLNDAYTIHEMLSFVRNEKGRPEAAHGAHDDCVMALAIAYYSRDQQTIQASSKANWTSDMLEDYNNASKEERSILLSKW